MMDQEESNHTLWLRKRFFSDPNRCLDLKTGDKLLQPGQYNERLFMVVEGLLVGSIENEEGRPYEIFRSGPGKIVGAYSFFADAHRSYSTVIAEEPSRVAYIERSALKMGTPENQDFAEQILPAVVDEIYLRQLQAHQLTIEREEAREQLARMEKLAALGQMAAGLAHELNNAIGVINNNAVWLADRMREYLSEKDSNGMFPFFEIGLESGITLSSAEVRQRSRELESRFQLSANQSKNLAKTGISNESLERFGRNLPQYIERISYYFETGRVLNDMLHASEHAAKVVASVQQLGAATRIQPQPTNLNETIQGALAIVKNLTKTLQLDLQLGTLPLLSVNPSDWVQVWINLIKNAAEAVVSTRTSKGKITIRSKYEEGQIMIQIQDNGPGIPEELKSRIFQPNVTTKVEGLTFGLGLGLSIVQKIVETYHGTIELESRPGMTVFTVKIPA